MEYLWWIVLILILCLIIGFQQKKKMNLWYRQKQYFFSYSELQFFYIIHNFLKQKFWNKYWIFPKVRLADIFEPNYRNQSLLNKIWSKHIDFLIVDYTNHCKPILWIELNWPSHFRKEVIKNDYFKKEIFEKTGLPLVCFQNNDIKDPAFIESTLSSKYLWNINKFWQWSIIKEQN